ncbi:coagulation factor IIIa [Labrus mixtus]|uniref:coagulation factor IIIa n=1 Tax=Labrus mixtus TaxID=508554 RepID=UPI0029C0E7D4|nr:coagulation factor IIIa [Labrus mixtus]
MRSSAAPCIVILFFTLSASGSYPKAQNVTWKSTNFKTILTWQPKPSSDYSYTVEFSALGGDKQKNTHCIRTFGTVCDLSSSLTDLKTCYTAEVSSVPLPGATSDLIEFPYTRSPRFCPYQDTDIGKPEFKLTVSEDKRTTTLYVTDPLTAIFKDDRQLNIRDIYSDQLQYFVTYRKNKSTGKKDKTSKSNVIEITGLDRGESYCFNVQAFIPSRNGDKDKGELSITQCTNDDQSFFKVYSVGVIAAAIFLILLLIGLIVAVTVVCYKCREKAPKTRNEESESPLRDV